MADGGPNAPPPPDNGGEFLLSLLNRRPYQQQKNNHPLPIPSPTQSFALDPAIAALGPTVNTFPPPSNWPFNNGDRTPDWPPVVSPPNISPNLLGFSQFPLNSFSDGNQRVLPEDIYRSGFLGTVNHPIHPPPPQADKQRLIFGSFSGDSLHSQNLNGNLNRDSDPNLSHLRNQQIGRGNYGPIGNKGRSVKSTPPPPGFSSSQRGWDIRDQSVDLSAENDRLRRLSLDFDLSKQIDHPGLPMGTTSLHSVPATDAEDSFSMFNKEARGQCGSGDDEIKVFGEDIVESLLLEDETENKEKKDSRTSREKESRMDNRGQWLLPQRLRQVKRYMSCRNDIRRHDSPFMAVFKSLIPLDEELEKQKQLMSQLQNLVTKEWPQAKLYLYGSCANSFGFPKSDIDVCLAMEDDDINKAEILLKLADILELNNFQNVQALTRARVPIVKLMDPITEISCDICINNVLAVVNTKLLRDYAQIDMRLRQLAFIVKHWAKSRKVNETYQGTLSSYAYVLMCIHFLQQRRPPILPCLQEMDPTYLVRVDNLRCAYFDKVDRLSNFGSSNRETIAELVWGFFNYWAYAHDYANSVVSVRTGSILGKREKDWTRRVGNDRHLICIEDPFETSHDLGRVVDKFSIRVLREEFERAAKIMHEDPNPCVKLFEPYVPTSSNNGQGHN